MQFDHFRESSQNKSVATPSFTNLDSAFLFHRNQLFAIEQTRNQASGICLPASGSSVLREWLNLERLWSFKKVTPSELELTVEMITDEYLRAAILRGLLRNPFFRPNELVLNWIGDHTLLNAMIVDLYEQQKNYTANFTNVSNRLINLLEDSLDAPKKVTSFLALASLHENFELPAPLLVSVFDRYHRNPAVGFALLEYLVFHQKSELLEKWIKETLQSPYLPFPLNLAIWLSLKHINPALFEYYLEKLKVLSRHPNSPLDRLSTYLEQLTIKKKTITFQSDSLGITMAQFMFHGSINQPGVGDSGGLSTFLNQLGNALVENPNIQQVFTFVTVPYSPSEHRPPLQSLSRTHLLVNIPVHDSDQIGKEDFLAYPLQLKILLGLLLREINPLPDVFHLRLNDTLTRVASELAEEMNIKTVLTLTADPHRAIEKHYENRTYLQPDEYPILNQALFRVLLADQLLRQSNSVVILPSRQGIVDLLPYFPQLPQLSQQKLFATIPEGIEITPKNRNAGDSANSILTKLRRSGPDSSHTHRPLILNVGRLSPIKQQNILVEAWLNTELWRTVDLVLIGGSASNPNPTEQKMLRTIQELLERKPEAKPYFFLLPALPNSQIRELENHLAIHYPFAQPPLYVCSSLKEEFGIAILEAMSAGWLVIGPQAGGLSSYIEDGKNGFLADTSDLKQLERKLMDVFSFKEDTLKEIAERGQDTIRQNYDIRRIAELLAELYLKTTSISIQKINHENHPDHQPAVLLTS